MEAFFKDCVEIDHDPQHSVRIIGNNAVRSIRSFEDPQLGLCETLTQNLKSLGYHVPTPIQCHGMPQMMAQLDIMCCSCTGSGKTATYLLPIIKSILLETSDYGVGSPRGLILTPTRELAEQICRDAKEFTKGLPFTALAVFGGDSIGHEIRQLRRRRINILVATPGRLEHLLSEFNDLLSLNSTKFLVIDEADEMFDKDFFPQITKIVSVYMKPKEELVTAMFSATFPTQIQFYARKYLRKGYIFVVVGTIGAAAPNIIQEIKPASGFEKQAKLYELLQKQDDKKSLVFCNTIEGVDILMQFLRRKKFKVSYIHSGIHQYERDQAIKDFDEGLSHILVATSVAARGLNMKKVALVINYDLPDKIEEYVQRIGRVRTSELGDLGVAASFYDEERDSELLNDLIFALRSANQPVPQFLMDDNRARKEAENLDEYINEDIASKMRKFKIEKVFEATEDDDWWG